MTNDAVVSQVIAAERRWVQAHLDLDIETLEQTLADDYVQIQSDGSVVGKDAALQSYRSGTRRWDRAESDEYRVTMLGDAAILVGRWLGQGENDGEPFNYTARFLAVYVRRDGVWRLMAEQSTPIPGGEDAQAV